VTRQLDVGHPLLARLRPSHWQYLVELLLRSYARPHRCHRGSPGVFYMEAWTGFRIIGSHRWPAIRDLLLECVDARYCPGPNGLTKAWRFRPEGVALLMRVAASRQFAVGAQKSSKNPAGTEFKIVNLTAIEAFRDRWMAALATATAAMLPGPLPSAETRSALHVAKHRVLSARCLLARCRPIGGGRAELSERYLSSPHGGRMFAVGVSLQNVPRKLREAAASGLGLIEYDIRNALPNLINQLTGGSLPTLRAYCRDTAAVQAKIQEHYGCGQAMAKKLQLMVSFGAELNGPALRDWRATVGTDAPHAPVVIEYARDIRRAAEALVPGAENWRRELALVAQRSEAAAQASALGFHVAQNQGQPWARLFDGYIIQGPPVDLGALAEWVEAETGFRLRFRRAPVGP